ncbi:hypothetical protein Acr_19g0005440 [Actinidia rufa]|uniref:Uncharacterized protein n=1 Tax=Actinidia rufa TaxID=165716 RepID=A0A7J0G9X3_9ERIC|nr:hypothetical protein Acr_19g0005440 [Actinidia rufa]
MMNKTRSSIHQSRSPTTRSTARCSDVPSFSLVPAAMDEQIDEVHLSIYHIFVMRMVVVGSNGGLAAEEEMVAVVAVEEVVVMEEME